MSEDGGILVQFLLALAVVLLLIVALTWILKKINAVSSRVGLQGAQPRLSITEALSVDHKRRLVLVKRDHVEHLLLIGGENDLLLEYGILPHPAQQARRQQTQAALVAQKEQAQTKPAPQTNKDPAPTALAATTDQKPKASAKVERAKNGLKNSVGTVAAAASAAMLKTKTVPPQKNPMADQVAAPRPSPEAQDQAPQAPSSWRPERPSETQKNEPVTSPSEAPHTASMSSPAPLETSSTDESTAPVSTSAGNNIAPPTSSASDMAPPLPEIAPETAQAAPIENAPTEEMHKLPPLPPLTPPAESLAEAPADDKAATTQTENPASSQAPKANVAGVAYDEEINRLLNELSGGQNK